MTTNILNIRFDASTIQGNITKNKIYKPIMSNPSLYSSFPNILFIPTIRLKKNLFESNLGEDDIKKIFLSPLQFNSFISNLKNKNIKPLSINEAKEKGIIYNNIKFILDLFFKKNDNLTIESNTFVINNYKWDNKYTLKPVPTKKAPIVSIDISLILHKGNNMTFTESTRLNCMQKKQDIITEYYNLVGLEKPKEKMADYKYIPKTNSLDSKSKTKSSNNTKSETKPKPKKMTEKTYYYGGRKKRISKKNKNI